MGIGNPGKRYLKNRHNVGFMFLDHLAGKYSLSFIPSKSDYYFAEHRLGKNNFSLIKPSTYVNNSGIAAQQAVSNYDIALDNILVVQDDIYLRFGFYRVKLSGGDGGHNGISSIIYHLATEDFVRIRIGVGKEKIWENNIAEHVLSDFSDEEQKSLSAVFDDCTLLVEAFILGGRKLLLDTNSKLQKPSSKPE